MELLQVEQGEQGEQGAEVRAEVRVVRWVLTGIGYTSRPLVLVLLLVYKLHLDAVGDILMEKEVEVSRVGSHDHVGGCGRCVGVQLRSYLNPWVVNRTRERATWLERPLPSYLLLL